MVSISEEARRYIAENKGCVTIYDTGGAGMCCGRVNFGPEVRLSTAQDLKTMQPVADGDITLYLPRDFASPHELTILLRSVLGFKRLCLEGWKMI